MIMKILSIVGARPNFIKIASIANAIKKYNEEVPCFNKKRIEHMIVHTGQHYDYKMSKIFFDELEIPEPNINLEVGSGTHAQQTAEIMMRFEAVLFSETPDVLLVVGDVNSTIACALVAAKVKYTAEHNFHRPIIVHVEAGLRSFDRSMPEEINRVLTDSLSDILFVTEESAIDNLQIEGCDSGKIHFVGNVMIDTLKRHLKIAEESSIRNKMSLNNSYGLITLHRPSNVDNEGKLRSLVECFIEISNDLMLIFPIHPRTKKNLTYFGLMHMLECADNVHILDVLGYTEFLCLTNNATLLLTDSGGIQEETTFLGVPCITLRENTERPVTVTVGTNYLVGTNTKKILKAVSTILDGGDKQSMIPKYWDGYAGDRIVEILVKALDQRSVLD